MSHQFAEIMFTEQVKQTQSIFGSLEKNEHLRQNFGPNDALAAKETDFISQRDSFYMATVSQTGWPYVQHRGGPRGFLKVVDSKHLAYADFRGNTQLVSAGNLSTNARVSLILMDYANRRRLKLLGHLTLQDVRSQHPPELSLVQLDDYPAKIERLGLIEVVAFDWNCPQHITRRFSEEEIEDRAAQTLDEAKDE